MTKEYKKGDVTVVWDQEKCKHAAECVKGAAHVFKPKERPWIQLENGTEEEIVSTVMKCPSGALTIKK